MYQKYRYVKVQVSSIKKVVVLVCSTKMKPQKNYPYWGIP